MVEIKPNFRELIKNKEWKTLKNSLNLLDVVQIADLIEETSEGDDILLFRLLSRELSTEVFQLLSFNDQEHIIDGLAQYGQNFPI